MSSKSLSLGMVIPKIVSVTKTGNSYEPSKRTINKKATVLPRVAAGKSMALPRGGQWVIPIASVASIAFIIGLVGFHLYIVNAYSSKGFELKRHQAAITELTEQQKRLLIEQAQLGSISKVNDAAGAFGLVPVSHEEYVSSNHLTKK